MLWSDAQSTFTQEDFTEKVFTLIDRIVRRDITTRYPWISGYLTQSDQWRQINTNDLNVAISDFAKSIKLSKSVKSAIRRAIDRASGKDTFVTPDSEDSANSIANSAATANACPKASQSKGSIL